MSKAKKSNSGKPGRIKAKIEIDPTARRAVFITSFVPNVPGWAEDVEGKLALEISEAARRAGFTHGDKEDPLYQHPKLSRITPEPLTGFLPDFYLVYLELEFDEPNYTFDIDEVETRSDERGLPENVMALAAQANDENGIEHLADVMPGAEITLVTPSIRAKADKIVGEPISVEDDDDSDPDFAALDRELAAMVADDDTLLD
jgi:hypothetical protein